MNVQKLSKLFGILGGMALVQLGLAPSASAILTLINDQFTGPDSTWTYTGTQTYSPGYNMSLNLPNSGILSKNDYAPAAGGNTLQLTITTGAPQGPADAFVGFLDYANWGGTGITPVIAFRSDQAGYDWNLQIQGFGSYFNSGIPIGPNQVLTIQWGVNQVFAEIATTSDTVLWSDTIITSLAGPQYVQLGVNGGNSLRVYSVVLDNLIPEPTAAALLFCGAGILLGWRRLRAQR